MMGSARCGNRHFSGAWETGFYVKVSVDSRMVSFRESDIVRNVEPDSL